MTEFTKGIFNVVKDRMDESPMLASPSFFIGHIIIAMRAVLTTGASILKQVLLLL